MLSRETLDAALAPARAAVRWGAAFTLAACGIAALADGAMAAGAVGLGGGVGLLAGRSMASGAAAALASDRGADATRRRLLVGALLRYPLMGAALATGVMLLGLPVTWLAVGVTAWPASLVAASVAERMQADAVLPRG